MRKEITFLLFLTTITSYAQNKSSCNDLREGVFETYEKNIRVGILYRKGSYQIERGINDSVFNITKIKSNNCLFYLNSYEIKNEIDTITWSVHYKKIEKENYAFTIKPTYLNVDYIIKGRVVKIRNSINEDEVDKIFLKLNN